MNKSIYYISNIIINKNKNNLIKKIIQKKNNGFNDRFLQTFNKLL